MKYYNLTFYLFILVKIPEAAMYIQHLKNNITETFQFSYLFCSVIKVVTNI